MKEKKIEIFSSLRGIACLIVVCAHIIASSPYIGKYASGCGKIGVWCFMIMSGFLSIYPYISGARDYKDYNLKSIGNYYLKKIGTLYPAFLVGLLLGMYTGLIPNLEVAVKHLLCIESVGHFWYMPVIIKFYILFPVFVLFYRFIKGNNMIYGVLIGTIAVIISVVFPFSKCPENSNLLRWYTPVFCMGMILALIYNWTKDKISNKLIFDVLSLAFICGIWLFTPLGREYIFGIAPSGWLQNKYLLMGALWSGIILCVLLSKYFKVVLIRCKMFAWLSVISYEMYLIHYIILQKLNFILIDMTLKTLLVVVISLALSVVMHYLTVSAKRIVKL